MAWKELRKPLPIPYKPIHVAWTDGDTFEFQPRNAKRMSLPADYVNDRLRPWQQNEKLLWNHWRTAYYWKDAYSVAFTFTNSGSSIWYHRVTDYAARTALTYPRSSAQGWSHDKTNHKFSFEFYLDNDLEEISSTEVYDDDETIWSWAGWVDGAVAASLSEELSVVAKGSSSLKVEIVSGTKLHVGPQREFPTPQDWSGKEFFCFYLYGQNTGKYVRIYIYGPTLSDFRRFTIIDNWTGWKRVVIPLNNPDQVKGSFDPSQVIRVNIMFINAPLGTVWYIDRALVDVGQWVKVETYVPDVLVPKINDFPYVDLFAWDPDALSYKKCLSWWDSRGPDISGLNWSFLNGDVLSGKEPGSIYGGPDNRGAFAYVPKLRGETATTSESTNTDGIIRGDVRAGNMTYSSYYGCRKRIGFAVKMPPDDGQDSSTYGISQCKLKLEVYYDKETYAGVDRYGAATFEFENSTNQYYGLQNINEAWIALFPASGPSKGAEMLFLSARPTGLEVSADEDEVIYKVKLTLPKGTAVYAGSLLHGDVTLDSDGDGVPDCLEMLSYQLTGQ